MTTDNDARRAHELVDAIGDGHILSSLDVDFLRSFLPELPKQMSLEAIRHDVHDVWAGVSGNGWPDDMYCDLETWLAELHTQLKGLEDAPAAVPTKPAHPEFLETEADYEEAPEGTVVVKVSALPWVKEDDNNWTCPGGSKGDYSMSLVGGRRVLRWGWGK